MEMLETNSTESQVQQYRFEFRGHGAEYFKIWIVNVGLTILTLGLYSAWAKVRTRRYFYNHLYLNGQTFDYHADPLKILKGRLIIGVLFASFMLVGVSPAFFFVPLVFVVMLPYLVVRGAIFNFTNTSHRGVRFGFIPAYYECYLTYIKSLLLIVFTLGIGTPAVSFWMKQYIAGHAKFGKNRFRMTGSGNQFWGTVMKEPFLFGLAYAVLLVVVAGIAGALGWISAEEFKELGNPHSIGGVVVAGLQYAFYGLVFVIYTVRATNYYAGHLELQGGVTFAGGLRLWDTILFYAEKVLKLILTLGLAWPWVQVEIMRYRAEHLAMNSTAEFYNTIEQAPVDTSAGAVGEEIASFWDFDIGF